MNVKSSQTRNGKRLLLLITLVVSMLLLVACGSRGGDETAAEEPTPTEAPAQVEEAAPADTPTTEAVEPTEEPVEEATTTSPIDSMEHTPDPMLVDITWEWVKRDPNGNDFGDITVPNPEEYTIVFGADGLFSAQVDCNNASGRYATTRVEDEQKNIFMEVGPMTMAMCAEDSLDTDMVSMFGPAQSYQFEDDGNTLVFNWVAGGPLDYYRNAATARASESADEADAADPDPVADDSVAAEVALPTADADAPTGRVSAESGVNVRTGPGTAYPVVGMAPTGAEGEIIGVSEDGAWWVARVPEAPDEQGWVAAAYVEVTNADDVAVIPAPPLPAADAEAAAEPITTPDELDPGSLILFSASRRVEDGNRVDEFEDIYSVAPAPGAEATLIIANAKQPALQPDGKILAFRSKQSDQLGLGAYDFEADARLRYSGFEEDSTPSWSPSGDRIVFGSNRTGDRLWRIYTIEPVAGVNPSDLAEAADLGFGKDPDWHPSEEIVVFKGCDETGNNCGLWTMNSDGSDRSRLTDSPNDSLPRWSPDGEDVVFMSDSRDGNWELYRAVTTTGEVTRLTENPANDGHPAWSPDGSQLAFMSNRDEAWGVWIMGADGGEAQLITTFEDVVPDWLLQGVDWPR